MKKILVITLSLSEKNGLGRYSLEMIKHLSAKYELTVFSSREKDGLVKINRGQIFKILPGLIYKLKNPLITFYYFFKIWPQVKKVDFIHCFMDYPFSFLAALLAWASKKPLFLTAHGTYSLVPFNSWPDKFFHQFALKRAKKIFCISQYTQDQLRLRLPLTNTTVINNGINFNKFNVPFEGEKTSQYKIILGVGLIKARKGYHISIPAMAKIKERYPNFVYYIVGQRTSQNYFASLQNLVRKLSLQKNVVFKEKISDEELLGLYQKADVFVLTPVNTKDNFEGFGLVYLEAGACGRPVVGTFGCGAQEAIEDGVTGILVPQNDVKKTAQAVVALLGNTELAQKMGQAGIEKARAMDWSLIVKKYEETYEQ